MPPATSAIAARAYGRLPQVMRDADVDFELLNYVAALLEPLASIDDLLTRNSYVAADDDPTGGLRTADLVDPATADVGWLPWQAQLYGVRHFDASTDEVDQRAQVTGARTGWKAGTAAAIASAAQSVLSGTKTVTVMTHYAGDSWQIGVHVLQPELPAGGAPAVAAAIAAADTTPAGHEIVVDLYATWDTLEAAYPTWTARESAGSWTAIESTP